MRDAGRDGETSESSRSPTWESIRLRGTSHPSFFRSLSSFCFRMLVREGMINEVDCGEDASSGATPLKKSKESE